MSNKIRPLDFSNVIRHAFLSGAVAARKIPPGEECVGPDLWRDYQPYEPGSYYRLDRLQFAIQNPNLYDDLAKEAADACGVTKYSDMRLYVEQAVKYALTKLLEGEVSDG